MVHPPDELGCARQTVAVVTCSGPLPDIKGGFTKLRYFDGSVNSFSGAIPEAWSDSGIVRLVRAPYVRHEWP